MSKDKKIFLRHTFNATPEELWDAWTDPNQFSKWFNPAPGYDLIVHEYDVREGGRIKFDMPQPNGDSNPQEGVFHVIKPYSEIVSGSPDKSFLIRITFEKTGNKTKMSVEVTGVPPEYHAGAIQGWNAGFNKLEKFLTIS
ncbi:MAG: SRPBCC domain-containing protein [Candidatus Thorarchaeota archaeon]